MLNQFTGTLIIFLAAIGLYYSWQCQARGKFTVAIGLLIVCGAMLRLYTSADFFLHPWDERYHALVAKHLINHPLAPTLYENPVLGYNFKQWSANHFWLHKQPLPLWTMAASLFLFGTNEIALRIPSIILTCIGIGLTFSIGRFFFNKRAGFLAAFFYSINGLIIEMTSGRIATDHVDVFFLFFIELAIFFTIQFIRQRKTFYSLLIGMSIGAAVLSKWLPALIVLPVWLLLVIDSKRFDIKSILINSFILVSSAVAISLPWQLYIHHTFPIEASWEAGFNRKHFTEVLEGHNGSIFYYINALTINYGELIYLPLLWFFYKLFHNRTDLKRWAILTWFLIPVIFFSVAKTKMQGYILFISPALFILTAGFWYWLKPYAKTKSTGIKWILNTILILMIVLPVRYCVERVKPFDKATRSPKWTNELRQLNSKNYKNAVLLNYERPIEAMFYTDLTAYSYLPPKKVIIDLMEKGYVIIINDNENVSSEIRSLKGVDLVHLSP